MTRAAPRRRKPAPTGPRSGHEFDTGTRPPRGPHIIPAEQADPGALERVAAVLARILDSPPKETP